MSHPGARKIRATDHPAAGFVVALRERRVELGLKQADLAARLGWSASRLQGFEAGANAILPRLVDDWAAALGMRVAAVPVEPGTAR